MTEFFDEPVSIDKPARKERHKRKAKSFLRTSIVLLITAIIVAFCATLAWGFIKDALIPEEIADYSGAPGPSVVITIPTGATGSDIADILAEKDVVASPEAFIKAFEANPRSASIQPGAYKLDTKISGTEAVAALLDPASRAEYKITIPEGTTAQGVYEKIANVFGVSVEEVTEAATDTQALGLPEEANGNLEGWLAPLTYDFLPDTPLSDVLAAMIEKRIEELEASGISRDQWQRQLIVASLVEREVNWSEYYPQVARAIENRLIDNPETNGYLQVDSSVLYGTGRTSGSLTVDELADENNPYNTYKHQGLPPTPICNPGIEVITATINPPEGDQLYWVTVNYETGETKFSATYEEHTQYVQELRAYEESQQE